MIRSAGKVERRRRCRQRTRRYCNKPIESDHCHIQRRLRAIERPRATATAWGVIQGIEAAQMIRKGQVPGITRQICTGKHGCSAPC